MGYLFVVSFGENLKRLRKRAGMKAKDLAFVLGVTPSVVSAWENDRGGLPETPTLFRLAKAVDCTVEELLSGVDAGYDDLMRRKYAHIQTTLDDLKASLVKLESGAPLAYEVTQLEREKVIALLKTMTEMESALMRAEEVAATGRGAQGMTETVEMLLRRYESIGQSIRKLVGA